MAPWADVLYACDGAWWDKYIDEVCKTFRGEAWAFEHEAARYGIKIIKGKTDGVGLGRHGTINTGGNSGYQLINLVYLFGATKIILLGYDMQETGGKLHWHPNHPGELNRQANFRDWIDRMMPLARDLEKQKIHVLNATRSTALRCFEKFPLEEALEC